VGGSAELRKLEHRLERRLRALPEEAGNRDSNVDAPETASRSAALSPEPGGRFWSIDAYKCYPHFQVKNGCPLCIKVCPFVRGPSKKALRLKQQYEQNVMNERTSIRLGASEDLADIRACVVAAYTPYVEIIGKEPAAMRTDFAPYLTIGLRHTATQREARPPDRDVPAHGLHRTRAQARRGLRPCVHDEGSLRQRRTHGIAPHRPR